MRVSGKSGMTILDKFITRRRVAFREKWGGLFRHPKRRVPFLWVHFLWSIGEFQVLPDESEGAFSVHFWLRMEFLTSLQCLFSSSFPCITQGLRPSRRSQRPLGPKASLSKAAFATPQPVPSLNNVPPRSPSSALKTRCFLQQKVGTLILTSLLEDLGSKP